MATAPQPTPDHDADQAVTPQTATEKESDSFLDRETYGQVTDDNNQSGQGMADLMDDSLRSDEQAALGSAPASSENLPDELSRSSEANFTLPETQHQGKTLTAESDE
ncbi:MAG: hypothetical protein ACRYFX_26380 [Janthinobacterium lividum]